MAIREWYITTDGDDSNNNGQSYATACRTITGILGKISDGGYASDDNIVYADSGAYDEGTITISDSHIDGGTLTFTKYSGATTNPSYTSTSTGGIGINIQNSANGTLAFSNWSLSRGTAATCLFYNASDNIDINIQSCTLDANNGGTSIFYTTPTGNRTRGVAVLDSVIEADGASSAFYMDSMDSLVIQDSTLNGTTSGIYVRLNDNITTVRVDGCTANHAGSNPLVAVNGATKSIYNIIIKDTTHTGSRLLSYVTAADIGANVLITGCTYTRSTGSGAGILVGDDSANETDLYLFGTVQIIGNTLKATNAPASSTHMVEVGGGVHGAVVAHNTIYSSSEAIDYPIVVKGRSAHVYNNIIYGSFNSALAGTAIYFAGASDCVAHDNTLIINDIHGIRDIQTDSVDPARNAVFGNIIILTTPSATGARYALYAYNDNWQSDYNLVYVSGNYANFGYAGGGARQTLVQWKSYWQSVGGMQQYNGTHSLDDSANIHESGNYVGRPYLSSPAIGAGPNGTTIGALEPFEAPKDFVFELA